MLRRLLGLAFVVVLGAVSVAAQVVTDGAFTIIYVYPDPSSETWDQHMNGQRPDGDSFSRAKIDQFVDKLMTPASPSYFDVLNQYGIHPPRFFGSGFVLQRCINAAMHDMATVNGVKVMQWDTIRSLSNCHDNGRDPSPQVILVFSPDIKIAKVTPASTGADMCATTNVKGWHFAGINTPNYIALPTDPKCAGTFDLLTGNLSHEIVETLSNPAGFGVGGTTDDPTSLGSAEIGDRCQSSITTWSGYKVTQYWSKQSNACEPRIFSPSAATSVATPEHTWLDASGLPLDVFTGNHHDHNETVSPQDAGQQVLKLQLIISTGNDNLRGGGNNCDVTLQRTNGPPIVLPNVNGNREWKNWTIASIDVPLPAGGLRGGDITGVSLHHSIPGFDLTKTPDNWNVQRIQLKAAVLVPLIGPGRGSSVAMSQVPVAGNQAPGTPFEGIWVDRVYDRDSRYVVSITSKPVAFGSVKVASYQISVSERLAPGGAKVVNEIDGGNLYPTLARVPGRPVAEHIDLPNNAALYLYQILGNGSFVNYGLRYIRYTPDGRGMVVDVMLQPRQSPLH